MIYKIKDIELDYSKISAPHIDYVPKLKLFVTNDSDGKYIEALQTRNFLK